MPSPTSSPPLSDAQLAAFRQKAGPILAEARGLTPAALAKLGDVARDLGLVDEQVQEAIRSLHAGPAKPKDPVVEKFRNRLKKDLSVKKKTIIGPEIEARIIAGGIEKYALAEPVILEVLADVAGELGLRRITGDEALAHFLEMVDAAVGDSTWLARQSWDRLRMASEKWGLSFEDADELVQEKLDANRRASFRSKLMSWVFTYGAIGLAACVIVTLAVMMMRRNEETPTTGPGDPGTVEPGPGDIKPPLAKGPPAWWDVELAIAISSARREIPGMSEIYNRLISETPAQRGSGYVELVGLGARMTPGSAPRGNLGEIIAGCYALEPEGEPAQELRGALLALIPSHGTPLTSGASLYERAFWGVGVARAALHQHKIRAERRAELAAALSAALGVSFAADTSEEEQKSKSEAALSSLLFQHLIGAAGKHPAAVPALHEYLIEHGNLPTAAEELEPLEAAYLAALLPVAEMSWRDHQELLTRLVRSKNPLVTLRMADLLSRVSDRGLQSLLAEELVRHTGAKPRTSDPKDVARAIRQALGASGVSSAHSQEDRWDVLRQEASAALGARPPRDDEHAELLQDTVELARLATLAAALSQGESGLPVFDELAAPKKKEEPAAGAEKDPFEEGGKPASPPRPRTLSNREKQQLEQYIAAMRAYHDETPIVRTGALRQLAQVAPLVPDLTYEQAAAVARYLLAEKSEAEQHGIQTAVPSMKRWRQLRLAVADQLEESKLPEDQSLEVARALLDESAASLPHDRPSFRRALMVAVYSDLGSGKGSSTLAAADARTIQQAAEELTENYRNRARLAGVAAADFLAAQSPAQALELLVRAMAKNAGAGTKEAAISQKLEAARFLGTNDLKKTVLLQRLLLEAAVERVSALRPRQAEAAALIAADLETEDAKGRNLLVQLYHGEVAILKLGMLYGAN